MITINRDYILRNSIIWVDLGSNKGHIQSGCRPCVVVSSNKANKHSHVYTIIPGTTQQEKATFPVHYTIRRKDVEGFLKEDTIFMAEQICTVDEGQIISVAGFIKNKDAVDQINKILIRQLELENALAK